MSQSGYTDYYRQGGAYPPPPTEQRRNYSPGRSEYTQRPNEYNQVAPYNEDKAYANYYGGERDQQRSEYGDYRSEPPRRRGSQAARSEYTRGGYDDRTEYDDRYSRDSYDDEPRYRRQRSQSRRRSRSRPRSRSRSGSRQRSSSRGFFSTHADGLKNKKEKHEEIIAGVLGAGAGGFLGNKFAGGKIGTIGGAVLGGIAAEEFEKHREKKKHEREMEEGMRHEGRGPAYDDRYDDQSNRDYGGRRSRSRSIVDRVRRSMSRSRSRLRKDYYDDESRY